ncbi:leucine-rich repeat-containing protein 15-like [Venturia canescens]|uniref:leucine-rich repeat-containing protein 15-like n=1 Tax=Venturia canescens TaxID=32260 RepID=UPI001C9CDE7A|nr:leucine-rich repeat-containing protein 15-like [Venturia canescens]
MMEKNKNQNDRITVRYQVRLSFFVFLAIFSSISAQDRCPLRCMCSLSHEPRKIICSSQEIESYPSNISDLVQQLDLSRNLLTSISDEINNLFELQYLNLANNKLESLPSDLHQLGQLHKLDLSNNKIVEIYDIVAINQLTGLKVLYLSQNPLSSLDELSNGALRALDASKCSINNITSASLRGLPELVTLSLEGNPLKSIQRLTSEKLRWLDLSDCSLNYLKPDTFEGAPDLEQLKLSNNPTLVYSSRNETLMHKNLKRLDVTGCNLDRPGLHGFPGLTHAILSKNLIRMLPDRIFAKNDVLSQLFLHSNGLNVVNRSSFAGLSKLEILDLSSNSIARLHPFTFRENVNLRILNLSYNDFEKFPNIMSTVMTLDISSNYVQSVPRQIFTDLPRLKTLDLSDNRLEGVCDRFESVTLKNLILKRNRLVELANDSFSHLPSLQKLDVSGTPQQ